jgi:hypothetical protein
MAALASAKSSSAIAFSAPSGFLIRCCTGTFVGKLLIVLCGAGLMAGSAGAQDDNHFRDFRKKLIGVQPLIDVTIGALITEGFNRPYEWGRGLDGFGKRVGNLLGQNVVQAGVELGAATWTHEDLRFRRSGEGGFWKRMKHAIGGPFWVRRDNGPGHTLAVGRIAGAFVSGQVARLWMPPRLSTFGSGLETFGGDLGLNLADSLVREFWPRKR